MLDSWARAYAERWGLPHVALVELQRVIDGVRAGDIADERATTRLVGPDEADTSPPSPPPELLAVSQPGSGDRYEDMGLISQGGMGEVRRVWDLALNRAVAMKVLRRDLADREDLVLRFLEEAQATAQLEHPGIVPVYDIGRLPDGRPYFTMKEIRGRTLLDVIEELHQASDGAWGTTASGWTFVRLISVFQAICEAVAFAHSRGVLHRDLKPTNIMVGAFGEVVVMDWGLAKVAGGSVTVSQADHQAVTTTRSQQGLYETRSGSIAGTPNYMPPEQARGDASLVGPWSDVYALGALLYEILADRAPYEGVELDEVVRKVLAAPPPPPYPHWQDSQEPWPEDGLRAICAKSMARDIAERHMDAGLLAEAVAGWLDSASARDRAITLVQRADLMEPDLAALRKRIGTLRAEAAGLLRSLPADAPIERKRPGWALEDQATELERELTRKHARYVELLRAALEGVPDLPEARNRLDAVEELTGRPLRTAQVPAEAEGWITVVSRPAGARVSIRRFEAVDRRLVAVPVPNLSDGLRTPLEGFPLPPGSYQLRLEADGHEPLTLLARVEAGELWSTVPAGTTRPQPVRLARAGEDPPDAVRIPGGWSWCGGDIEAADSLPRSRSWVDAFLIRRHPVTNSQLLEFLADLERSGRSEDATRLAPPGWTRSAGGWQRPEGEEADWPVRRISFEGAEAFAAWTAACAGRPWRLPREREWERAARGVDERLYPWGDFLDPAWCCVAASHRGAPPHPASIHDFPHDVSPWGVRGLGGNVSDWCVGDGAPRSGAVPLDERWVRGGHYLGISQLARGALRYRLPTPWHDGVGLRLVCSLES